MRCCTPCTKEPSDSGEARFCGCSPRARGRHQKEEVKENQDTFPVTSCYTKVLKIRAPRSPGGCQETEAQAATVSLGAKGQPPLHRGSTPAPGTSWPSWSKCSWGEPSWLEAWGSSLPSPQETHPGDPKPSSVLSAALQTQTRAMTTTQTFPSAPISYCVVEVSGLCFIEQMDLYSNENHKSCMRDAGASS